MLVNLVVNALRHSGSEEVQVEAKHGSARPRITISVIDHGRGIAEDDQARVFEKFRISPLATDDPTADTGLGLPFCKLAVERMGGRIALTQHAGRLHGLRGHAALSTQ